MFFLGRPWSLARRLGAGHLFNSNLWELGFFRCVLNGHVHQVTVRIQININVFAYLASLGHSLVAKFEKGGIRVPKILNFYFSHPLKSLSKNAL